LVSTKLPHYVAPTYPAIAITLGVYLTHWRRGTDLAQKYWTPIVLGALIVVGVGLMTTMVLVLPKYFPNEQITGVVIGLVPLLIGIVGVVAYRKGGRKSLDIVYILLALTFFPVLFQWAAGQISKHAFHDREFFHNIVPDENSVPPLVVCVGMDEPSWIFYSGQPMRKISVDTLNQCANELELRNKLIELDKQRPKYLSQFPLPEGRLYIIISTRDYPVLCDRGTEAIIFSLPNFIFTSMKEIARMRRFMRNYDQLLLQKVQTPP
jgi:hypothetical protein